MQRLDEALRFVQRWRLLEWATLLYVSLPFLVFVGGWITPWVAVPSLVLVVAGLARTPLAACRAQVTGALDAPEPFAPVPAWKWVAFLLALGVVVGVVLHSGTGGYAVQYGGHWRNNSFIKDLAAYSWPLGFQGVGADDSPGVLAFYIANALVPALVAKVFGWEAGFFFQFAWTVLAVSLTVGWFMRVVGSWSPGWVLFFLFFGGLDIIGYRALVGPYLGLMAEMDLYSTYYKVEHAEMGGVFWILPSNLTVLFNSPHHVLCAWLVLLMILDDALRKGTSRRVGLLCAFALLWSAFSFVGMAPFVILSLFWTRGRDMWSFENLGAGVCVLLLSALYIGSNNGQYVSGPIWDFLALGDAGLLLLLVVVIEFGLHVVLLQHTEVRREGLAHPAWRWTAAATLVCCTLYRIGDNCDFTTKASIPALLVLQLCIAHALAAQRWRRPIAGWALAGAVCIGTLGPVTLFARSARLPVDFKAPRIESVAPTNELERDTRGGQLFSDGEGFFWSALAKPVEYQPTVRWQPEPSKTQMKALRRVLRKQREPER